MSLKMQADVNLLQAHYNELEIRLNEMEAQLQIVNRGIHTLIDGGDAMKLTLVKEDRTPVPRKEIPKFDFDVDAEMRKIKRKRTKKGKE